MSNQAPPMSNQELLSLWLENKLDDVQQEVFEARCLQDKLFAQSVADANQISALADIQEDFPLPEWPKEENFDFSRYETKKLNSWWQWSGMPLASMACSAVALFMVLTGFNVQTYDGRVSVGFSAQVSQHQIDQIVEQKLQQQQQTNQVMFAEYLQNMQEQQALANAELTRYVIASNRQERREDFAELIKFVNDQRRDDQLFYANQLKDLQQELTFQTDMASSYPSSSGLDYTPVLMNQE